MATEIIEMGSISTRGQVAIPAAIRRKMGLEEGTKVIFLLKEDALLVKKVKSPTFAELTQPLKDAIAESGMKEEEVVDLVHEVRKKHRENNRRH